MIIWMKFLFLFLNFEIVLKNTNAYQLNTKFEMNDNFQKCHEIFDTHFITYTGHVFDQYVRLLLAIITRLKLNIEESNFPYTPVTFKS